MRKIPVLFAAAILLSRIACAQPASLETLLASVAKYDANLDREPLIAVETLVSKAQGATAQREIEARFVAFLKSDASLSGKDFVCRELSQIGSDASVPVLSGMLLDAKTADMARYALERIPGPAVNRALREALPKTTGRTRIGIINSLGRRRDGGAVAVLAPLASGPQADTAAAALFALGEIADPAAIQTLADAQNKTSGPLHESAAEAYLRAADRSAPAAALPIYKQLYAARDSSVIRAGALLGLARSGNDSIGVLLAALRDNDARLQAVAITALAQMAPTQLIAESPKLGDAAQVRALAALAGRGEASVLPAFTAALKSSSQPVRVAALEGLARVGNASVVPGIAQIAATGEAPEQTAARAALAGIRGKEADQAVLAAMASAEPKVKLELIRAAGERGTPGAAPVLLKLARDSDNDIRRESLRALREAAGVSDVPGMVALVVSPLQAEDRAEAVRGLSTVMHRSDFSRAVDVISAYRSATDAEARMGLLQVLGPSGNPAALAVLREALQSPDAGVKRAAILALSEWPDSAPIADLFAVARSGSVPAHEVLALRGILKLIAVPAPGRPAADTVQLLADVLTLAKQTEEKRAALALLPRFPTAQGLDLAKKLVDDRDVSTEAKAAVTRLERSLRQ